MKRGALALVMCMALFPGSAAAAPQWLSTPDFPFGDTDGQLSAVTMAPDGTVTVARIAGAGGDLTVRTRPPGGSFSADTPIDSNTFAPVVLVRGPDDGVAVVYRKADGLWVSVRRPGGSFSAPHQIDDSTDAPGPSEFALDDAGTLWFLNPSATSGVVLRQVKLDGTVVSVPIEARAAGSPNISVTPSGHVTITYLLVTTTPAGPLACVNTWALRETEGTASGFAAPVTLATAVATGTVFQTSCASGAGERLSDSQLAVGADGSAVDMYQRVPIGGPASSTVQALYRAPGGSWSTTQETVDGGTIGFTMDLVAAGSTFIASDLHATGLPAADESLVTRQADGTWVPHPLGQSVGQAFAAGSSTGAAVVTFMGSGAIGSVVGAVRAPDGTISAPTTLAGPDIGVSVTLVGSGVDDQGNAVVGWYSQDQGGNVRAHTVGYDGAGPRFSPLTVPTTGTVGQSLAFAATPVDVWSPAATPPTWSFGDGSSGAGGSVAHTYGAAGTFPVSVTATDALGNSTTSAPQSITITSGGGGGASAPTVTGLHVKPSKVKHGKAAKLTFTLNVAAKLRLTIAVKTKGEKQGKRCVKRPRHAHGKHKSCTRFVTKKTLSGSFAAGPGSLTLPKTLRRGSYRITVVATGADGQKSKPTTVTLTVR